METESRAGIQLKLWRVLLSTREFPPKVIRAFIDIVSDILNYKVKEYVGNGNLEQSCEGCLLLGGRILAVPVEEEVVNWFLFL